MTRAELQAKYMAVDASCRATMKLFSELMGDSKSPLIGKFGYEATCRMEEFLHRTQDCMAVLIQASEEGLDEVVDQAIKDGKLSVVPDPVEVK